MRKPVFYRVLFYALGLLVLALGLTLNTKTGLGVSPIISVAYSISEIFDHNFGNMTLALYSIFVVIQMILHLIRDRKYTKESGGVLAHAGKTDRKLILLMDFLQIPLSLIFTRFLNIFSAVIPDLYSDRQSTTGGNDCQGDRPRHRHYPDGYRRRHVAQYAHRAESRRRHRAGDRRYDPQECGLYKELF